VFVRAYTIRAAGSERRLVRKPKGVVFDGFSILLYQSNLKTSLANHQERSVIGIL
jgi:hypothetical protein